MTERQRGVANSGAGQRERGRAAALGQWGGAPARSPRRDPEGGGQAGKREPGTGGGRGVPGVGGRDAESFPAAHAVRLPRSLCEALSSKSEGKAFSQKRFSRPCSRPGIPRLGAVGLLSLGVGQRAPQAEATGVLAAKAFFVGVGFAASSRARSTTSVLRAPRALVPPEGDRMAVGFVRLPPFPLKKRPFFVVIPLLYL